ncbi:MAG: reverse transcriptase N-terminal domain-containing protein [Methanosarcinaceae archaeon]|nr:reverse transcriptase N-terminal domain-containing protein [Methanosarcinaceae archaeon]
MGVVTDVKQPINWEQIDWTTVERNVNKLQTRVPKVVRQNRRGRAINRSFLFDR